MCLTHIVIAAKHTADVGMLLKSLMEGTDVVTSKTIETLKKFDLTSNSSTKVFLGVNSENMLGRCYLTWPSLIATTLEVVGFNWASLGQNSEIISAMRSFLAMQVAIKYSLNRITDLKLAWSIA